MRRKGPHRGWHPKRHREERNATAVTPQKKERRKRRPSRIWREPNKPRQNYVTSTVLCYFARRARRMRGRGHSRPVLKQILTDRQSPDDGSDVHPRNPFTARPHSRSDTGSTRGQTGVTGPPPGEEQYFFSVDRHHKLSVLCASWHYKPITCKSTPCRAVLNPYWCVSSSCMCPEIHLITRLAKLTFGESYGFVRSASRAMRSLPTTKTSQVQIFLQSCCPNTLP